MKGFVKVDRTDALSAIIGFEVRYKFGGELLNKGIELYYDKKFKEQSRITQWWNRHLTKRQFARKQYNTWGTWSDILYIVLTSEECDELDWWCWTHKSDVNPIKSLYKASCEEYILVDQDMAAFINKYKDYLEKSK